MTARPYCLFLVALTANASASSLACPGPSLPPSQWTQLQSHDFTLPNDADVQRASLALLDCLANPDPKIRDSVAMEALTTWLRGKRVATATAKDMLKQLAPRLRAADESGFARPFAALALAEIARMDRIDPYLDATDYAVLVHDATQYLSSIRDYRGFDEREGWRHGVAHGADLLMQLTLNPRSSKEQLDAILAAVAMQVAPSGEQFYVYGEGARLARPVLFIAQRHVHSTESWSAWLRAVGSAAPLQDWNATLQSQAGLAKRHNTLAFFNALFVAVENTNDAELTARVLKPLRAAMGEI